MKRLSRLYLLVLAVAIFSTAILAQAAKDAQPGSEFDPLVTKSYVDEQIQKLSSKIGKRNHHQVVVQRMLVLLMNR